MGLRSMMAAGVRSFSYAPSASPNQGGPWGWLSGRLPGAQYDYEREAGLLHKNSVIAVGLKWEADAFAEAPFCVRRKKGPGWQIVDGHPLTQLIQQPNPDWDETLLMTALLLSLRLDGNAYVYVTWNALGEPLRLDWIPHWLIEPRWTSDGKTFISHYDYKVGGKVTHLPVEDVIHFRDGIDPANWRKGMSALKSVLREVCTDNESATFAAAIMRNMGVPGCVVSPEGDSAELPEGITPASFAQLFMAKFTGDRRGEPFVSEIPIKVQAIGLNPEEMILDKVRRLPESRIAACFKIPPVVLGLEIGIAAGSDKHNYESALEAAYRHNTLPRQRTIGSGFQKRLMPRVSSGKVFRAGFDNSEIMALQEDENERADRATTLFEGCVAKRSEAKEMAGLPFDPVKDDVYFNELEPVKPKPVIDKQAETDSE